MGIGVTFSIKAPKLVVFFKGIGIDIDSENGVFTERSYITLPSGDKAFFYDDDSIAKHIGKQALYDDEEGGMPRWLHGMEEGDSLVEWFINHLVDVGEEYMIERFNDKQHLCLDFCQEAKEIIDRSFPEEERERIKELDELIEEASFLYLSSWGGDDFDYAYVEVKDGKASYRVGSGLDDDSYEDLDDDSYEDLDDDSYEEWYWDSYSEFVELVKEHFPAVIYKRQNGMWVKDKG